jgi:hypothetical protein
MADCRKPQAPGGTLGAGVGTGMGDGGARHCKPCPYVRDSDCDDQHTFAFRDFERYATTVAAFICLAVIRIMPMRVSL